MTANPLGYCQLSEQRGEQRFTCQQPLCVRGGKVECQAGHPQPDHPLQRQLDEAAKAQKEKPAVSVSYDTVAFVPEPTWAVQARRLDEQDRKIAQLEARLQAVENHHGMSKPSEARGRKAG